MRALCVESKQRFLWFSLLFQIDTFLERIDRQLSTAAVEALALAGKRGVLGGMGGIEHLPDKVICVEKVPYT